MIANFIFDPFSVPTFIPFAQTQRSFGNRTSFFRPMEYRQIGRTPQGMFKLQPSAPFKSRIPSWAYRLPVFAKRHGVELGAGEWPLGLETLIDSRKEL